MRILLDLHKLSTSEFPYELSDDDRTIWVTTQYGTVALSVLQSNHTNELVWCKPIAKKWETMHVIAPMLCKGLDVFGIEEKE